MENLIKALERLSAPSLAGVPELFTPQEYAAAKRIPMSRAKAEIEHLSDIGAIDPHSLFIPLNKTGHGSRSINTRWRIT